MNFRDETFDFDADTAPEPTLEQAIGSIERHFGPVTVVGEHDKLPTCTHEHAQEADDDAVDPLTYGLDS